MQEPMIRSGGIEGETTSSGSKVRKLTPQEILAYQAAEEAVQEELIRRSKKEIKVIKSTDELQINSDEKLKNAQKNTIIGKELVSDKLSEPLSSQNTATATPDIRVSNEANVNTKKKRKLEANEFEIIGKALESIVKHRYVNWNAVLYNRF